MSPKTFVCSACGNIWNVDGGTCRPAACPACGSSDLHRQGCDGSRHHHGGLREGEGHACGHRHHGDSCNHAGTSCECTVREGGK